MSYDVHFNDDEASNNKGFNYTQEEAIEYIHNNNGCYSGYFKDYKGGIVSVVCNKTGETVYEEEII